MKTLNENKSKQEEIKIAFEKARQNIKNSQVEFDLNIPKSNNKISYGLVGPISRFPIKRKF